MTRPTIEARLRRRFIAMTRDEKLLEAFRKETPEGWEMVALTSPEDLGDWNEVILYRFLLLDLNEESFDPVEVIRLLRREYMLNLPVFGFGGDKATRARMKAEGADRAFTQEEMVAYLPRILKQFAPDPAI